MRDHCLLQHLLACVKRHLPERCAEFSQDIATPNIIHQDVQAALLGFDSIKQRSDVILNGMIGPRVNTHTAVRCDHFSSLLNSFRSVSASWVAADTATTAIDCGSGFAKSAGDAAPGSPCSSRNHCNFALKGFHPVSSQK